MYDNAAKLLGLRPAAASGRTDAPQMQDLVARSCARSWHGWGGEFYTPSFQFSMTSLAARNASIPAGTPT